MIPDNTLVANVDVNAVATRSSNEPTAIRMEKAKFA